MTTVLNELHGDISSRKCSEHNPEWSVKRVSDRFVWVYDHGRAILLIDEENGKYELRCHGPQFECPPDVIPAHYHLPAYEGVCVVNHWSYDAVETAVSPTVNCANQKCVFTWEQEFADGSRGIHRVELKWDADRGAYVIEQEARLKARRVTGRVEFANMLPANVSDSRPESSRFPYTVWSGPEGLRKLGENPLWFNSAGAQDVEGRRRIPPGGFLGFGPDEQFNPVIEVVESSPPVGACTCDNLQDEHLMVCPPEGHQAESTGWFDVYVRYRVSSIYPERMKKIVDRARDLEYGPFLAWKFQYPHIPELPDDLNEVELPWTPFEGQSDFSEPAPWNETVPGRVWTASPCEEADIYYDRSTGRQKPGSIRLRVDDDGQDFAPKTGHSIWTREGHRYRFEAWIKTEGECRGWIRAMETLYRPGDSGSHASARVGPDSDWTRVEVEFTARGDEAPFANTVIHAEGTGKAWFTELALQDLGAFDE